MDKKQEPFKNLKLPYPAIRKIISEAVPPVRIEKDARSAFVTAATVFIAHIVDHAIKETTKVNRANLEVQDIVAALTDLGFEDYVEPSLNALKAYKNKRSKKQVCEAKGVTADKDHEVSEQNAEEKEDHEENEEIREAEGKLVPEVIKRKADDEEDHEAKRLKM